MTRRQWSASVKASAGNKCQFCGSADRLESHHIKPLCDYPQLEFAAYNGVCLCHSCHVKAHGGTFYRPKGKPINYYPQKNHSPEETQAVQAFISTLAAAIDEKMERDNGNAANYDRVELRLPKGLEQLLQDHAESRGETLNGFVNRAIQETLSRDLCEDSLELYEACKE